MELRSGKTIYNKIINKLSNNSISVENIILNVENNNEYELNDIYDIKDFKRNTLNNSIRNFYKYSFYSIKRKRDIIKVIKLRNSMEIKRIIFIFRFL